jgi:hypothetical protein
MARVAVTGGTARGGLGARTRETAREVAPWLVRLGRLGYAAKGVVYLVVGVLAARAAFGTGGTTTDSRGALRAIGDGTAGQAALLVIGVSLLGYTLWQLVAAATDAEGRGGEPKGIALRLGQAGRGLLYGSLGVEALRLFASGNSGGGRGGGGDSAEHWTARLMDAPLGRWLVIAAGLGVAAYALYQLYSAAAKDPRKHLDLRGASPAAATAIARFGRFGIAARGVVFALVGWFVVRAGLRHDPQQAGGIDESLATLAGQPYGPLLLGAVAVGLVAYGLFQLANARYRRMGG